MMLKVCLLSLKFLENIRVTDVLNFKQKINYFFSKTTTLNKA